MKPKKRAKGPRHEQMIWHDVFVVKPTEARKTRAAGRAALKPKQ